MFTAYIQKPWRMHTQALIAGLLGTFACTAETPPEVSDRADTLFDACVAERDRQIHEQVFATVDNPDVQRELLITKKEQAIRECRERFPEP
ncbi:MAG: hypothetical protein OEV63_14435 [Gammaproteobacteria bacterium]|nr:hypothetical protein [Gammaproteobacteria bacterium]MDH5215709.1 hypothetical protein [Gammaproteobacteria bacterium]MDH5500068.1 hypothetical protein [Gammaproteobacteria bacterium]